VILINWGAILHGKLMIMLVGTEERQQALLNEFKQRVSVQGATRFRPGVLLTPKQMERVTAGQWRNLADAEICITGVNFYLPWVKAGDLFVLRERDKATCADYARTFLNAVDKGAVAAIVTKDCIEQSTVPLLEVENVGKAFQDIALASSLSFDGAKVLVAGSHGKTGFKTQLYHILNRQIPSHACLDSANLQHPVWRALTSISKTAKVAIIEAAVPAAGIGQDRSFFIRPDFCVITGIGPEHLSSHKSIPNLIRNKAAVVTGLRPGGKCILNADDPYFDEVRAAVKTYSDCEILTFGTSSQSAGRLVSQHFSNFQWEVSADILGETVRYTLPMIEDYAPLASVGVLLVAKLLGADPQRSASDYMGYKNFESSGNLYEVQLDRGSSYVYDQSRRGEWKGFESMFELMSRLKPARNGRKVAVLTEFINLDDNPNAHIDLEHMQSFIEKAGIDVLYSVHRFKEHSAIVPSGTQWKRHGETVAEIQEQLIAEIRPDDMVFIRGIEDARLDQLVNKLVELGKSVRKLF
jgi:UDP-N-acetylmuramoyl-tripeptide--D-alanyl-D-alanine ligase